MLLDSIINLVLFLGNFQSEEKHLQHDYYAEIAVCNMNYTTTQSWHLEINHDSTFDFTLQTTKNNTNIYTNKTNGSWYVPCDSLILRNSKTNESFSYIIDSYKLIKGRNRLDYCSISNGYTGIHYL